MEKVSPEATWKNIANHHVCSWKDSLKPEASWHLEMCHHRTCSLSGRCDKSRSRRCQSHILQPGKFHEVQWSVTNRTPFGLTINQALVSLGLAIVADVTSCKKLRLGLALKGKINTMKPTKKLSQDVIAWHFLDFWGIGFGAECILRLFFIVLWVSGCKSWGWGQGKPLKLQCKEMTFWCFVTAGMKFQVWNTPCSSYSASVVFSVLCLP